MAGMIGTESLWRREETRAPDIGRIIALDRRLGSTLASPAALRRLLDERVFPLLVRAHPATRPVAAVTAQAVERFVDLLVTADVDRLLEEVEALLASGLEMTALHLDLLAPAALRLGERWEADLCSSLEVTVGRCRLQQIVYELADRLNDGASGEALFADAPGRPQAFGLSLAEEVCRRAGWRTRREVEASALLQRVADRPVDVVGVCLPDPDRTRGLAADLRAASCNRELRVLGATRAEASGQCA